MISGFGKFCVKNKKKGKGRNPATGEDLMLAPRKVVTFQSSMKLREKLQSNKNQFQSLPLYVVVFEFPEFMKQL